MCLNVLSSLLRCPLRFSHKNDVRFVFTSSCLWEAYLCYLCLFAYSGVQHIVFCVGFVFLRLVYPMLPLFSNIYFYSSSRESFSGRDSNNIPASAARLVVPGTRSSHLEMKPESESMLAMAGSFSSQRSSEETSSHHSNNTSKMEERAISDPDEAIVIKFPDNDKQSESSEGFSDITTEEHKALEEMSESEVKGDNFDKKDKSESETKRDNFENKDKVDILEQHSAVTDDSKDNDLTEHGHENIQLKIETDILQTSSSSEPGTSSPEMIQSQGEDNSTASGEDNSLSSPEILKPADDDNSNVLEPGEDYITSSPEMIHSGEDNSNVSDSSGIEEQYDMVTDEISKSDGGENSKKQDEDDTATG